MKSYTYVYIVVHQNVTWCKKIIDVTIQSRLLLQLWKYSSLYSANLNWDRGVSYSFAIAYHVFPTNDFCLRLYFTKLGKFKLIDANINDNRHNANTISLNCIQSWLNVMQANTIYRFWMKRIEWLLNLHVVLLLLIYWKIGDKQIYISTKFTQIYW